MQEATAMEVSTTMTHASHNGDGTSKSHEQVDRSRASSTWPPSARTRTSALLTGLVHVINMRHNKDDMSDMTTTIILSDITKVLHKWQPLSSINIIGSRMSGLATKNSDVDLLVTTVTSDPRQVFGEIKRRLTRSPPFTIQVALPNSRIPILKIWHRATNCAVDITIQNDGENRKVLENTRLIQCYTKQHHTVATVFKTVKFLFSKSRIFKASTVGLSTFGHFHLFAKFLLDKQYIQHVDLKSMKLSGPKSSMPLEGNMLLEYLEHLSSNKLRHTVISLRPNTNHLREGIKNLQTPITIIPPYEERNIVIYLTEKYFNKFQLAASTLRSELRALARALSKTFFIGKLFNVPAQTEAEVDNLLSKIDIIRECIRLICK